MLSLILFLFFMVSVQGEYIGNDGVITFWGDPNFKGEKWEIHRTLDPQYCYSDNVGKPSSIKWKNQITKGKLFGGKAKIAFYNKKDCEGLCLAWPTSTKDFPANLEADHFDNQIKSFMIWQSSVLPDVIVRDVRRLRRVE
ncbi:hypothetical protein P3T76_012974 [Phytophthora citrophthora]|uniref:Uncharacterized protein n=1 Tax=Phytophthora citrophthora TaxID=4793 RepID=A0AAD9G4Q3_9STRA|nr:hypothetical protein P3T76_012974 [Phytophthora citrophthora]